MQADGWYWVSSPYKHYVGYANGERISDAVVCVDYKSLERCVRAVWS